MTTVTVNGTPVDIAPSDLDLANARLMLDRFAEPHSRDSFARYVAHELATQFDAWLNQHGEQYALISARLAIAVSAVHAELVAGRQS